MTTSLNAKDVAEALFNKENGIQLNTYQHSLLMSFNVTRMILGQRAINRKEYNMSTRDEWIPEYKIGPYDEWIPRYKEFINMVFIEKYKLSRQQWELRERAKLKYSRVGE